MDACDRPLAHSTNATGHTHDLEQHLRDVARQSADFARKFGAADLAYWAGLWHDLGKHHPDPRDLGETGKRVWAIVGVSAWGYSKESS